MFDRNIDKSKRLEDRGIGDEVNSWRRSNAEPPQTLEKPTGLVGKRPQKCKKSRFSPLEHIFKVVWG
jgi:hypothetical protein